MANGHDLNPRELLAMASCDGSHAMSCLPDVIYLRSWICLVERKGEMGQVRRLSIPVDGPHIFTGSATQYLGPYRCRSTNPKIPVRYLYE